MRAEAAMTDGTSSEPSSAPLSAALRERAEHAKRMHYSQITRRTLTTLLVVLIVLGLSLVGFRVMEHVKTSWFLEASGFHVDWQIDETNWRRGGNTSLSWHSQGWMRRFHVEEVKAMSRLFGVKSVNLSECPVTEQGLSALREFHDLEELNLSRLYHLKYGSEPAAFGDGYVVALQGMSKLQVLSLAGNRITDEGLAKLVLLPSLEIVDLRATEISDAGLIYLQKLPNLKSVALGGTQVTLEGVKKLQSAMPGLEIEQEIEQEIDRIGKNRRLRQR
jgi:hypothetical protein